MNDKRRCVIYCRVSTDEQKEKGNSLDAQKEIIEYYAKSNGYEIVHDVFSADEVASVAGRPVFNAMLDFIKLEQVPCLLVLNWHRLSRNDEDKGTILDLIKRGSLTVVLVEYDEVLDKDITPKAEHSLDIEAADAKYESRKIGMRTKRCQGKKMREGGRIGLPEIGYINAPDPDDPAPDVRDRRRIVVLDPERKDFAIEMFTNALKIPSFAENSRQLADKGFRTRPTVKFPDGKPISDDIVGKSLRSPFYKGWYKHRELDGTEEWRPGGKHKALVSEELWAKVQKVLDRKQPAPQNNHQFHPFRGLLRCEYCGCLCTVHSVKKTLKKTGKVKTFVYYHCTKSRGTCPSRSRERKYIEEFFNDSIVNHVQLNGNGAKAFIKDVVENHKSYDDDGAITKMKAKELSQELHEIKRQEKIFYQRCSKKILTNEEFIKSMMDDFSMQKARIRTQMEQLNQSNPDYTKDFLTFISWVENIKREYPNLKPEHKNEIAFELISEVTVNNEGMDIQWKKPFNILFSSSRLTEESEA